MISSSSNIGWLDGLNEYIYGFHRTQLKIPNTKRLLDLNLFPIALGLWDFMGVVPIGSGLETGQGGNCCKYGAVTLFFNGPGGQRLSFWPTGPLRQQASAAKSSY